MNAPLNRAKIMIVDDSAFMRQHVSSILKKFGFWEILEGDNARNALSLYIEHRPDLVILDLKMPDLDGLSVLKEIKKINPKAKVVVLTADGQKFTIRRVLEEGAYAFLIKPFDLEVLCDVVLGALIEEVPLQKLYAENYKLSYPRANGGFIIEK